MSRQQLISVIVPVYNGERYIGECIESIIGQTHKDIELIIVDDGSTDSTPAIIKRYAAADRRIRLIRGNNKGPSAARNTGLDNASGAYITFVDADDLIAPQFIEMLLSMIEKTGAQIASCDFTERYKKLFIGDTISVDYSTIKADEYVAKVLYKQLSNNSVWSKLFVASLFKDVRFIEMRYEDLEIFPRLCMKADMVAVTDRVLYYYRPNDDSFIHTFSPRRLDALKAMDMIDEYVGAHPEHRSIAAAARARRLSASFNIYLITAGRPEHRDVHQKAWSEIKRLRKGVLRDPKAGVKIKVGALCSYAGGGFLKALNRLFKIST